jgi:riboflavin kinase / FMN adenylyltransferase
MKVYHSLNNFQKIDKAVVTIGTFDGVHLGHQKILSRLKESADKINGETVVLTFFPHPRMVLQPTADLKLLNTLEEKIDLLASFKIDHLIIHPFSVEFSELSSSEFIKDILVDNIGVKKLIIGYDHHFGKNREGSFEQLKQSAPLYKFEIEEISKHDIENIAVSSTKIRNAIIKGETNTASKFLGYPYFLTGKVVKGNQLGRKLGFPTANIEIEEKYKLIPAEGIYAVNVISDGEKFRGMLSIGKNPTIPGKGSSIEVNIFNFDKDIYGSKIRVEFILRMRDELKFENLEQLQNQLHIDKENAIKILHLS